MAIVCAGIGILRIALRIAYDTLMQEHTIPLPTWCVHKFSVSAIAGNTSVCLACIKNHAIQWDRGEFRILQRDDLRFLLIACRIVSVDD